MNGETDYGNRNPQAPPELSQFAFIIGEWRCDVRVKGDDGTWQTYAARWIGRYILDGYAIADPEDVPAGLEDAAKEAIVNCPEQAIVEKD